MDIKEMAFRVEDLSIEAEKADSMCEAIYQAIYCGENNTEVYQWAFVTFREITSDLKDEMEKLKDQVFETMRGEKQ